MEDSLVGRFAVSLAGHDKGALYVIVAQETQYVYLCDGKNHTLGNPKKKSMKHVSICGEGVIPELQKRIINKDKVFDHEIKYAIKIQQA